MSGKNWDWGDDPEWKRFEADTRANLIPQMKNADSVLVIAPDLSTTKFDVMFALQIGASVLMEKPLVVVVLEGQVLPPKLERLADRIVIADLSTEIGRERAKQEVTRFYNDFGKQ